MPRTNMTDIEKFLESHFIPLRQLPSSPTSPSLIHRL
ncbi:DUF6965 family protein [Flavobacterium lindanitolerans]